MYWSMQFQFIYLTLLKKSIVTTNYLDAAFRFTEFHPVMYYIFLLARLLSSLIRKTQILEMNKQKESLSNYFLNLNNFTNCYQLGSHYTLGSCVLFFVLV